MLLKCADDKSKRLALLDDLQRSRFLDDKQRAWLKEEFWSTKNGIDGERQAAHYIDMGLRASQNHVVLHDLRLVDDGQVAQIDHLIINRGFIFYLVETKCFNGNVVINGHGEFTVEYGQGRRYGIESPIEQSRRHEVVLLRMLERLGITGRTQAKPQIKHVVLVHPKATITRPPKAKFDTTDVIKADQFLSWRDHFVEKRLGVGAVLAAAMNLRSLETITEWGELLKRQHRPQDLLALPEFMMPRQQASNPEARSVPGRQATVAAEVREPAPSQDVTPSKKLVCATCGAKISYAEGKFCWNQVKRFGGLQYCRAHQADHP